MSNLNVLVVGASIAGPATAYWLAKAGADVTIIERFPELRTNGQGIDIRTAGVTVMRKMPGMEPAVRAKTTQMEGMSFVREDGRPYGVIKPTGNPDQQSLISEYEVFRGDLAQILYDLTKENENIRYVFGEQVTSMKHSEKEDGPITVEFTNILPTSEYDLVVACDGATSRTRAMGLGCGARDYVLPTNFWAVYFSVPDMLKGSTVAVGHSAVGGRSVCLGPDPAGVTRATLFRIYPSSEKDATLPFREATKRGDDALKDYVAQQFRGIGWKAEEILDYMMEADDWYASEVVQVKCPNVYNGRFAMVGDAGYATGPTGGGTSVALAGAYLLAGELCKHKGNIKAGLEGYETQIRPIITELQKIPPFVGAFMAPQTAWGLWLRNHLFAFITWSGVVDVMQKFFAGSFAHTDQYKMPEYEWVR
ncbi:uncharacterized protein LTR77_010771 [Saxophila tyrrhenica]|uniref:FAD-binding domain-containing protein n=1 Tax=Saxophila tyrrhenica TaxID=1690608 RepID=A0AAV9NUN3_9PEZI|nr:hypothetical protein LTR77_010771 [Saxophila tyrrhenica]